MPGVDSGHYRRLERMYQTARVNEFFQPRLVVSEGAAEVVIPVRPEFHHAANAAHGAVLFKALDDAAFFAANSLVEEAFVLTAQFNLHFLRPIAEGEIRATGRVTHFSRRQILAEAVAVNGEGKELARGTGTFMTSSLPLRADIGYG